MVILSPRTATCSSSALAVPMPEAKIRNTNVVTNRKALPIFLVRSTKPPVILFQAYLECDCEFLISYTLGKY